MMARISGFRMILLPVVLAMAAALGGLATLWALPSQTVMAATITVTTTDDDTIVNGNCTLREAIIAANTDTPVDNCPAGSGADTITLGAGVYTLTVTGAGETAAFAGDLNITYALTVTGADMNAAFTGDLDITDALTVIGAGQEKTFIDGGHIDRVFQISLGPFSPGGIEMAGMTIRNGSVSGPSSKGGGIFNESGSSLALIDITVTNNTAGNGGGIFLARGNLSLTDSTISDNTATVDGGGIYSQGDITLSNSTVRGNAASPDRGGGGIANVAGTVTLTNSTVSGNSAGFGGGIAATGASSPLAASQGGSIWDDSNLSDDGLSAVSGEGSVALTNTTVSNNSADRDGGGILAVSGAVASLLNTIVATSPSGGDCFGIINSLGHNLDSDNTCSLTEFTDISGTNPLLDTLQDNGGPTFTHALVLGSQAIDAGDDSVVDPPLFLARDQRGEPRLQGPHVDIGAYEFEALFVPGDCNGDGKVDAGDTSATVLEIFDGDGTTPPYGRGAFAGTTGCDANSDGTADAGDIACTVLIIFGGLCGISGQLAGGPGAIYVGDLTQLVGPAPTPGLGGFDGEVPLDALERHLFLYESDYYQQLLNEAQYTNPTTLVSTGETITIQHACINRALLPCKLIESFYAPNVLARTGGQVQLQVTSLPELGIPGPDTLKRLVDGTLDMANVFGGFVAGSVPAIEIQSLWGIYPDTETGFNAESALLPDLERIVLDGIGAGVVANHNWFAGNDQYLFCNDRLEIVADFTGKIIRSHSAALSDWIGGMGATPQFVPFSEVYAALQLGDLDCGVTGADPAFGQKWYEVTTQMNGPLISFASSNNVINQGVWDSIPTDLQQILLEEGAKSELEALRLAAIQNEVGVQRNTDAGLELVEFSAEIQDHSFNVAMIRVIPGWTSRLGIGLGCADAEVIQLFNEKLGPLVGIRINPDCTVEVAP